MQVCKTCGESKPLTDYPIQQGRGQWRGSGTATFRKHCKACVAAKARAFRLRNPGYRGSGKVCSVPPEMRKLVSLIRMRHADAVGRGDCTVSVEDLLEQYTKQGGRCAISGFPLVLEKRSPWVPSLDQVAPGAGYHAGNVQWVAWAVNRAKGDLNMQDFLTMCRAIVEGATTIPNGSTPKRVEARSRLVPDDIV